VPGSARAEVVVVQASAKTKDRGRRSKRRGRKRRSLVHKLASKRHDGGHHDVVRGVVSLSRGVVGRVWVGVGCEEGALALNHHVICS
jgi:hypothetical protein